MPYTLSVQTGGGIDASYIKADLIVSDSTSTNLQLAGQCAFYSAGNPSSPGAIQVFTSSFAGITPTGSGTQYLTINVNLLTGAVTTTINTTGIIPAASGTVNVFTQTVPASVTSGTPPSQQGGWNFTPLW